MEVIKVILTDLLQFKICNLNTSILKESDQDQDVTTEG